MSSIFGSNTATQSGGTGLFGSNTTQNQTSGGGGLFGSTTTAPAQNQGSNLFGGGNAQQTQQPSSGTSLFGGNTQTQQSNAGTSLFGGNNTTTQNQPQTSSLFGGNTTAQNQPQTSSLFGGTANQTASTGTGLFGSSTTQNQPTNTGTSLFGGQSAQNTNPGTSLFGNPQQASTSNNNNMNSSTTAPHQTHLSTLLQSGLGAHPTSAYGALGSISQQDLARSRLAAANISSRPNEKTVYDQIRTVISKWDPNSVDSILQAYLYNAVNAAYAPFYYRNADEQEEGWEAALAKKPENITLDGGDVSFVPVLVRGFRALGARVEYQAQVVNEMRARLHEMNNSLDAVMKRHEQSLTLRVENARRQHAVLSQRCLRLAVKAQVLRHKNYPLDAAEESLRKTLMELEKRVFDPAFQAREEEIWARMVALRERARWLDEESKKLGVQLEEQKRDGSGVSDEILQKTKRILSDYDGQLRHLAKELGQVTGQFEEWEQSR